MSNEIKVVIGSWGSYNECNERAMGSKWLTLNDYEDWEEIAEELEKEGFELEGIDEELFIQDIENFIASDAVNWDYINPQTLFELLKKSGILDDIDKFQRAEIFCEVQGYHTWENLVNDYEENWDDDMYLYPGFDWYDLGKYFIENNEVEIPEFLENFIDYRAYGEQFSFDGFYEYSDGIVEIRK